MDAPDRGAPRLPAPVSRAWITLVSVLLVVGCSIPDRVDGAPGEDGAGVDGRGGNHVVQSGNSASVTGSGHLTSRRLSLIGVTELAVGAGFVVRVRIGEPAEATVWMDDNLTGLVDATVTGKRLHLGLKPGANLRNVTLSADVTVRDLDQLSTEEAGHVTLAAGFTGDELDLEAGGVSHIAGRLRVEKMAISASGAGTFALSGSVGHLDLDAAGTSGLRLSQLAVRDLDVELSGASCAVVTVSDTIAARTSGASALRYSGAPRVTREQTAGASSIVRAPARGDRCGS